MLGHMMHMLLHLRRAVIVQHFRAAAYGLTEATLAELRLPLHTVRQDALIDLFLECVETLAQFTCYLRRALLYLDDLTFHLLLLLGDFDRGRHRELLSIFLMLVC